LYRARTVECAATQGVAAAWKRSQVVAEAVEAMRARARGRARGRPIIIIVVSSSSSSSSSSSQQVLTRRPTEDLGRTWVLGTVCTLLV
jgi:hypothetical protein